MHKTFKLLAGYNSWANARLYDAAVQMQDSRYREDRGAFFGSVHRTLNHILVADRIWLFRFGARTDAPLELDVILFDDLAGLRAAREAEDQRITGFIDGLTPEGLDRGLHFQTVTNPQKMSQPLGSALVHFFNHQTHHRGQIHALMTALEGRNFAPSLDLILFQRTTGIGMS
ncbi:damage-inducible protein DinB [Terrihabitans soli]|uniref:Damage-inducible protein DinB n=1 Tax=Terrihabitans soli TaxID=708113 RepID=A0A6S6QUC4_9HYPH|nr:DinB family protein [Terrihabitans soli]BCJ90862.1 damage-inducible protein DinB [Terrihabitans soli]